MLSEAPPATGWSGIPEGGTGDPYKDGREAWWEKARARLKKEPDGRASPVDPRAGPVGFSVPADGGLNYLGGGRWVDGGGKPVPGPASALRVAGDFFYIGGKWYDAKTGRTVSPGAAEPKNTRKRKKAFEVAKNRLDAEAEERLANIGWTDEAREASLTARRARARQQTGRSQFVPGARVAPAKPKPRLAYDVARRPSGGEAGAAQAPEPGYMTPESGLMVDPKTGKPFNPGGNYMTQDPNMPKGGYPETAKFWKVKELPGITIVQLKPGARPYPISERPAEKHETIKFGGFLWKREPGEREWTIKGWTGIPGSRDSRAVRVISGKDGRSVPTKGW